ncbi:MAG: MarR family winged helix-turn-helix transcriptional regulator [Candidatus Promineifilaceae bacterium]|jgi:MarR family 2-MHQ and catechol resistance regulon transcriptional repressor
MPTHYRGTKEEVLALNTYIKLQRAAEMVLGRTTKDLKDHNLTVSQFAVLEALYHLGTLSQRSLAEKLLKSTGNISIVLKNMEKRELIERHRAPEDNRYMKVSITDIGRSLIDSMFTAHVAGIVDELSVLSAKEQEELGRLCRKLGLHKE